MTLFSDIEIKRIVDLAESTKENVLITFRQKHGPTQLMRVWTDFLKKIGLPDKCVSWWSGAGSLGLLECEREDGPNIYGQWVLDDKNHLLGVFEVSNAEVRNIRQGYDAQSVTDSAMRAIRIGESGGELE
ncbi:MAG: hypothetical protein ACXAEF_12110 [Candidatus Thorarchaeota archaeon]|jgi:hypothetical protein